jgi:hypothetical protein
MASRSSGAGAAPALTPLRRSRAPRSLRAAPPPPLVGAATRHQLRLSPSLSGLRTSEDEQEGGGSWGMPRREADGAHARVPSRSRQGRQRWHLSGQTEPFRRLWRPPVQPKKRQKRPAGHFGRSFQAPVQTV